MFAIVIIASIWRPSANANQQGAAAWEYAIVTFRAQDAVVFTNEDSFFMEGPEIRKPERVVGDTNLRLVRPIEIEHLTALGMKGWEVVEPWGGGQSYLLRRRR
jgi:hypothetical protein